MKYICINAFWLFFTLSIGSWIAVGSFASAVSLSSDAASCLLKPEGQVCEKPPEMESIIKGWFLNVPDLTLRFIGATTTLGVIALIVAAAAHYHEEYNIESEDEEAIDPYWTLF